MTIQNPEGYSSEYLLYAAKLLVDLDMKTLIKSMGKTLEIEQALLSRIDALLGVQHYFSGLFPQDLSGQKAQSLQVKTFRCQVFVKTDSSCSSYL